MLCVCVFCPGCIPDSGIDSSAPCDPDGYQQHSTVNLMDKLLYGCWEQFESEKSEWVQLLWASSPWRDRLFWRLFILTSKCGMKPSITGGKTSYLPLAVEENKTSSVFSSLWEPVRLRDVTFYNITAKWKTAVNIPVWFLRYSLGRQTLCSLLVVFVVCPAIRDLFRIWLKPVGLSEVRLSRLWLLV